MSNGTYQLSDILSTDFETLVAIMGANVIDGKKLSDNQEKVLSLWEFGQSLK